jgi:hypothetical protein
MSEKPEKKLIQSIPTHLSLPRRIIGPFTRMQLLLIFLGAICSANLYASLAFLDHHGAGGLATHLLISLIPLLLALLLATIYLASRSLGTWCVLALRHWYKPREVVWKSICQHDVFSSPAESLQAEKDSK